MDAALPTSFKLGAMKYGIFITLIIGLLGILIKFSMPYSLPIEQFSQALFSPDQDSYQQVILHYSYFPRLMMALLCGAGLALAGSVMQTVLRNPLASPTTLWCGFGRSVRSLRLHYYSLYLLGILN